MVWYPFTTMKKDDLYIAILKHGYDKVREGVTYNSTKQHLKKLGYDVGAHDVGADDVGTDDGALYYRLFHETFTHPKGKKFNHTITLETKCFIDMDAYFKLVEYTELKEARRSSKIATYFAIAAIVISIVAMVISIYFSYKQLKSPTKIETTQFEKIEEWVKGK